MPLIDALSAISAELMRVTVNCGLATRFYTVTEKR